MRCDRHSEIVELAAYHLAERRVRGDELDKETSGSISGSLTFGFGFPSKKKKKKFWFWGWDATGNLGKG